MARRGDPGEALARALHQDCGRGAVHQAGEGMVLCGLAQLYLARLAAEGWRLTREPELTVERLARAVGPLLPQHKEGLASLPPSPSDRSWVVYDGWQPAALAAAILAALEEER